MRTSRSPSPSGAIGQQLPGMNQAQGDKPVDRLLAVDRVAARDRHSGFRAHRRAANQDLADHLDGHDAHRHADNGERENGRRPHRIDVRQRVGRGDPPELERVIDHGHEEVRGGDQRLFVVETPDRRVVGCLRSNHQVRKRRRGRHGRENVAQDRRRQLASAAAAMRQRRQADVFWHCGRLLLARPDRFDSRTCVGPTVRRPQQHNMAGQAPEPRLRTETLNTR